ncbi:lysozyme inhibitor LprI family protein [Psychrobacter sp. AOP22-C1-C5]|uniref:lysozyme inhibitor LprI family protein n=1 Tax=Psychrobacter sp. AOP22-C1-C5 TaxID=3457716 RepID=UPI004035C59E
MQLIKNNLKKVSGMALLSVGLFATAQASAAGACDNANTQADINKCTATQLSTEDSKLNRSYSDLQRLLSSNEKKQLKTAQLAWIDFRDKACKFSARGFSGGSAYSMALNGCLTTYTHQRRVQLDEEIDNIKNK